MTQRMELNWLEDWGHGWMEIWYPPELIEEGMQEIELVECVWIGGNVMIKDKDGTVYYMHELIKEYNHAGDGLRLWCGLNKPTEAERKAWKWRGQE